MFVKGAESGSVNVVKAQDPAPPPRFSEKNTSNIFWTQDHQWGTFGEDMIFPLEKLKILRKILKNLKNLKKWAWLGWDQSGGGVTKMEKNFFAFLDELDHLEAIKKY